MRIPTILYHDVVDGEWDASGYPGAGAARYKLRQADFEKHLDAIALGGRASAVTVDAMLADPAPGRFLITFDDGGASSLHIADRLEARGWRGHFFITTGKIGAATFLTRADIRELHGRGHVIGTHTRSHPHWMSDLPREQLLEEWSASAAELADIVSATATTGSVPGGATSREVTLAARDAGLRVLFNSQPTTLTSDVDGCVVLGRFAVRNGTSAQRAAALVHGLGAARLLQSTEWAAKGLAKRYARRAWEKLYDWRLGQPAT